MSDNNDANESNATTSPPSPANREEKKDDDPTTTEDEQEGFFYFDTLIVGAGAAGIGVAHALLRGGVDPEHVLIVEQGPDVGHSFRTWQKTTRFISPSWPSYPFGQQDLNSVVPDTSVHGKSGQHPTGDEYADYLHRMMIGTGLAVEFDNSVTKLEKMRDMFLVHTKKGHVVLTKNVVWAAGEWHSPKVLSGDSFEEETTWHYRDADLEAYSAKEHKADNPVIIVGGGEAGVDIGCALAAKGVHVLIAEAESEGDGDEEEELGCGGGHADDDDDEEDEEDEISHRKGAELDPSRNLAPVTRARLERASEYVTIQKGARCTGTKVTDDGSIRVEFLVNGRTETRLTTSQVILCTGFDISQNPVLKDAFEWNDGSPVVTPAYDESTVLPGLFLAGPMLVHMLAPTCGMKPPGADEQTQGTERMEEYDADAEEEDAEEEDETPTVEEVAIVEKEESKEEPATADAADQRIIFCFVYKYRTRFAVLATKIIHRILQDRHLADPEDTTLEMNRDYQYWDRFDSIKFRKEGQILKQSLRKMQTHYQMKGMYLTDLSCSQLACGMSTNDTPIYPDVYPGY